MPTALELETRQAPFSPASWNAEARTIEALISTGADVQRRDAKGPFIERLDLAAIDPASLAGIPVLDGHRQTGSEHVVGVVESARREGASLVAIIRLSGADDVRSTVLKVQEGVLRGVSVGYVVTRWTESKNPQSKIPLRTAVEWTIREVSLVGIPADPEARIRSEKELMPDEITPNGGAGETPPMTPAATETRADLNAQIRSLAETAGLDRVWADAQIDAGADIGSARSAALDAVIERTSGVGGIRIHVGADNTDPAIIVARQAEALAQRMGGPAASEPAQQYLQLGFVDFARDALSRSGVSVSGLSAETILTRAMHTTSDFPLLLEQGGNRVVSNAYQVAASPLVQLAVRRTVSDLRDVTVLKAGEMSPLKKVNEAGEIKSVSMGEAAEGYAIETYGGIFSLSRKLLINDQFGVFGQSAARLGTAAAQAEADALVSLLTQSSGAGPVMSDGKRLFHADHGNLAASGAALDVATLSAGRQAMRTQKGLDGVSPVGVRPAILVVGPAQETKAEQILATLNATSVSDQNPFAGTLTLIVEPRITGNAWYLFGDKATAPVLEMAYLASASGPQIATREGWEVLGREFRVTLDLGVGATDWRGAYRNPGA
ncbi:MAG: Mu-like prophage major head subunit gpT family protein [Brevundimonas sp.]|uniref:prohead protease/major capsid protein fusion protein n=1 Tax=Brevundimonas sp. TaxID=1871086 RepID=UPI0025C0294C|nr:prohead protease/major capsid protein fusion protein [Brevundimonas sp.]MBX3476676.1 Mu-like prophage major head subunit gpT family protein [Brevundimonas sp.]